MALTRKAQPRPVLVEVSEDYLLTQAEAKVLYKRLHDSAAPNEGYPEFISAVRKLARIAG
jgi:hypothetical protein